jgi:chemotaxis family two-component system response regulator PixG
MFLDDSSTGTPSGLLGVRSRMHFTGRLDVRTQGQQWSLYLYMGRLVWATGGPHPKRRWHRYMLQNCPHLSSIEIKLPSTTERSCVDHYTLTTLVKSQLVSPEQAVAVIRSTVSEVLFDIIQQEETKPVTFKSSPDDVLDTSLALLNAEQLLMEVQELWTAWRSLGLANHSPNLAPILRHPEQLQEHTSEKVYKLLMSCVDGRRTLRDLAMLMKQDVLQLTRVLVPLYRKGLVALVKIPDLAAPTPKPVTSAPVHVPSRVTSKPSPSAERQGALIACIDDSLRECQIMEQIVTQAGYRFLGIHDSIQALPTLIERKPDLIFLDLVMPVVNGYEICAQIRRVSVFRDTPIVILTSNDGIIDRVRAKIVRSSGFLAKPVESNRVLAVIQKLLPLKN